MRYGTVVQFFPEKGFGFIRPDVGADVFFHISALGACDPEPRIDAGQPVKFELAPRRISRPPSPEDADRKESARPERAARPQAQLVELIDAIPGGIMEDDTKQERAAKHPRARQKKPTWRR